MEDVRVEERPRIAQRVCWYTQPIRHIENSGSPRSGTASSAATARCSMTAADRRRGRARPATWCHRGDGRLPAAARRRPARRARPTGAGTTSTGRPRNPRLAQPAPPDEAEHQGDEERPLRPCARHAHAEWLRVEPARQLDQHARRRANARMTSVEDDRARATARHYSSPAIQPPSIGDRLAGDVAGAIGGEKSRQRGELARLAEAPHRNLRLPPRR